MKCLNCGKEFRSTGRKFCTWNCFNEHKNAHDDREVLVICTKVPEIYKELRPRLGEAMVATRKVGPIHVNYVTERGGKHVLLRGDEVMEVAG